MEKDYPGGRNLVRKALRLRGVPDEAMDIEMASLKEKSLDQYEVGLRKWWKFCHQQKFNPLQGPVSNVLSFLTSEFKVNNAAHGTLNSFRSAIALLYGPQLGEDPQVKRFFRGVANLRPQNPKYNSTWDPGLVLTYFKELGKNDSLSLEKLSKKLATLLALVTGHRMQTLALIDIRNIKERQQHLEIKIPDTIKTSGVNKFQPVLSIPFFTEDNVICPATLIKYYLEKTKEIRKLENKLIISFRKPYGAVSTQTLSRWIKQVIGDSGVDVDHFSAYSTRHASTSAASRAGVTIDCILKTAGWTTKSKTFATFYKRDIVYDKNEFALSILRK